MIDEEEYFRLIEEHFLQKRGNPMLLSPREWSLIREWYEAAIPQEVVLRAIDRGFEKRTEDKRPLSLRYCSRLIKSEHKKYLKSLEGKGEGEVRVLQPEAANVQDFLQRLAEALQNSGNLAAQSGNQALSELFFKTKKDLSENILTPFSSSTNGNLQRVEEQLTTLEKEIEQVLLQMISEDRMTVLKEEAMRELKMFEGKVELPVYQEMLRRSLIKAIRKSYNLPRLSLFYM